jgi:predicted phage terminase large subunit-like protein
MFAPFKRNPRTWSSLYQQRPAPDTGVLFKKEWLKTYEQDPSTGLPRDFETGDLNIYGASDYAVSDGKGDYTVHIVVGVSSTGDLYVLDLWRKQVTADIWVESFCDLVRQWKPLGWAEEVGQIKSSIGPFLTKRMRERKAYVARAQFPTAKSKQMRAQSIIGRMAERGLFCPFGASWFSEFRRELLLFDAGKHDDQVDALALIGQVLDKMVSADTSSVKKSVEKVFSTNPATCTVTLDDMWEANEQRGSKTRSVRIQ